MVRINKILILFLAFVFILWSSFLWFVESHYFSGLISEKITSAIKNRVAAEVKFDKINVSFFPLASNLENVIVRKSELSEGVSPTVTAKKISFYFSVIDIWKQRLSLKKISVHDGIISLNKNLDLKENFEEKLFDGSLWKKSRDDKKNMSFSEMQKFLGSIVPIKIKKVNLENMKLKFQDESLDLKKISLSLNRKTIGLSLSLRNYFMRKISRNFQVCDASLVLSKENLLIKKILLQQGLNKLSFEGNVFDWSKKKRIDIKGMVKVDADSLNNVFFLKKWKNYFLAGRNHLEFESEGLLSELNTKLSLKSEKLKSLYFDLDEAHVQAQIKKDDLIISSLDLKADGGQLAMSKPKRLYNLKKGLRESVDLEVIAKKFPLTKALWAIQDSLYPLKSDLSGLIGIRFFQIEFYFYGKNKLEFDRFFLNFSTANQNKKPILEIKKLYSNNLKVDWKIKKKEVLIDTDLSLGKSFFNLHGVIEKDKIFFKTSPDMIRFSDLGAISGLEMLGDASFAMEYHSDLKTKSYMTFKGPVKQFKLFEYNFGDLLVDFKLDFKKMLLTTNMLKGKYKKSDYTTMGSVDFNKSFVDLDFDFQQANYLDSLEIYSPLFKKLSYYPPNIIGSYRTSFKVTGPFDAKKLKVFGNISSRRLLLFNEAIKDFKANFAYHNNTILVHDSEFKKNNGAVNFDYQYLFKSSKQKFQISLKDMEISEIKKIKSLNLGANGDLNAFFKGEGIYPHINFKGNIDVINTYIGNQLLEDSNIDLNFKDHVMTIQGNILKDIMVTKALLNFNKKNKKESVFSAKVNTDNIALIPALWSKRERFFNGVEGEIDFLFESKFDIYNIQTFSAKGFLKKFDFSRDGVKVKLKKEHEFIVEKGKIKKWDFQIQGPGLEIATKGKGDFKKDYKVESKLDFDASLLELISSKIMYSRGKMNLESVFFSRERKAFSQSVLKSSNFSIGLKDLPAAFNNIDLKVKSNGSNLKIKKFEGFFGKGKIMAMGSLNLKLPYPEADISFNLDKSSLDFFENSKFLVSGAGQVLGKKFPLKVSGNFSVLSGLIQDELNSFQKKKSDVFLSSRYLPQVSGEIDSGFFDYDISFNVPTGIQIKNSMANFSMEGAGEIVGGEKKPRVVGEFKLVPGSGRLLFNNNDFILNKASVSFLREESEKNPRFDIVGNTITGEYDIRMQIKGSPQTYDIDLSSEPALGREDILSLLTLGFTEEVAKSLEDEERQSLSSVGIGSLLFDKFQINQGIKSSLGLRLSVSPEFLESEESLLTGRSSSSNSGASTRVKTASKIKVQKQLSDELDISVSSTVGGDIQQRQEMNLNYRLNKNMSVEGIYEINTDREEQEVNAPNALGLDFKFRWNFK